MLQEATAIRYNEARFTFVRGLRPVHIYVSSVINTPNSSQYTGRDSLRRIVLGAVILLSYSMFTMARGVKQ